MQNPSLGSIEMRDERSGLVQMIMVMAILVGAVFATERIATTGTFHTQNLIVDTNAKVATSGNGAAFQIGPTAPDPLSVMLVGSTGDNVATDALISSISDDTNHLAPGIGIDNERINLLIRNNTTFDTGGSNPTAGKSTGIDIDVEGHTSAGALQTTNVAIYANASTGTSNYCFRSDLGEMRVDGSVNFNAANPVDIGQHVLTFRVPGSTSLTPEADFGYTGGVDGFNIHIKNTANGVNTTGMAIGGDTSITGAANIAPQIALYRGAGGGFGTGTFGLICMDNGATSCGANAAANDMVVLNYATSANLFLGAKASTIFGTTATTMTRLTSVGHWVQDASTGAPGLDAGCTSGGGSSVVGNDNRFEVTTGATSTACTVTFHSTWTSKPICQITTEGGIALPTYTVSATAVTITVNLNAGVYNIDCQGQPGST